MSGPARASGHGGSVDVVPVAHRAVPLLSRGLR
jgi:hypothetical protein